MAACRLIEQYQPEAARLFNDPVVKELVDPSTRGMLQSAGMRNFTIQQADMLAKGIYGELVCRTRYIDEAVQAALEQGTPALARGASVAQVVILGAGLDTRAYRLPGMAKARVFELDLPRVQEDKRKKLGKIPGLQMEQVAFIPIDFDTQSLQAAFAGTALDLSKPVMYIWEGVTQYISEQAVRQTLEFVGKSAPSSRIVFTYILKRFIQNPSRVDTTVLNAAWIFGFEPADLAASLQPFHLSLLADIGDQYYQEKYLLPLKRKLDVFAGERIALAQVTNP